MTNYPPEITKLWTDPYLNGSKSLTDYSARELMSALYETGKKQLIEVLEQDSTESYSEQNIEQLWQAVMQADEALRELGKYHLMRIIDAHQLSEQVKNNPQMSLSEELNRPIKQIADS